MVRGTVYEFFLEISCGWHYTTFVLTVEHIFILPQFFQCLCE